MNKPVLRRILSFLRPRLPLILFSLLLNFITVGLTLLLPILVGQSIDCIIGPGNVSFQRLAGLLLRIALCIRFASVADRSAE